MPLYELTYLISPELNEGELKDFSRKINSLISKTGKISKSESPKKITLAYPIQKKREAFLGSSEFSVESQKIENLKKELEKEKQILRFLLIKKKGIERTEKPQKTKEEKSKPTKKAEIKEIEEKLEEIL
ncbi:30S ribosomal protein S6 [bacterium]|nr:30S ribosomal protein S6 [bacterium]